jgi:hypothetical protein
VEDIITNATEGLKGIPQTSFKQCFQGGKAGGIGSLLHKGIVLQGVGIQ